LNLTRYNLACLLTATLLASCIAAPGREEKGLLAATQRVLALDFSSKASGPRLERLGRMPQVFAAELRRTETSLLLTDEHSTATALGHELQRSKAISGQLRRLVSSEWQRQPHATPAFWPTSFQFAKNTADSVDTAARMIGIEQPPMIEISDRVHRTDYKDERPELTFWQRLARRLPW